MFYDKYVNLCKEKNISPSKAASMIGFDKSSITNWKKHGYVPRQEILNKIADFFGVSVDYLTGRTSMRQLPDFEIPEELGHIADERKQLMIDTLDKSTRKAHIINNGPGGQEVIEVSEEDYEVLQHMIDMIRRNNERQP